MMRLRIFQSKDRQEKSKALAAPAAWKGLCVLLLSLLPFFWAAPGLAAQPAGTVEAVAGKVTAAGADGAIRPLSKGGQVFSGDTVSTGPNSRVRILFSDKGLIFLRPSTRFVIDSYKHSGDKQEDESRFSLVKGGFRSVTGAIGQANKEKVTIETPVATIGIRGTDHEGRFCAGDCLDLADIGVSAPPDGLYTATNAGQTVVGGQPFGAGQYGFTSPVRETVRLPEPPPILNADPELRGELSASTQEGEEGDGAEQEPGQGPDQDAGESPAEAGGEESPEAGQQPAQTPQGEQTPDAGEGEAFEIPAQPATTRAVQCN